MAAFSPLLNRLPGADEFKFVSTRLRRRLSWDSNWARRGRSVPPRPTALVEYTNGAGNNLFQYCYTRLLAEDKLLSLSQPGLHVAGFDGENIPINANFPTQTLRSINDFFCAKEQSTDSNFIIRGYPENYLLFKDSLGRIRSWFHEVEKIRSEDLVLHLRMGDRLLLPQTFESPGPVSAEAYSAAIRRFQFRRLHIVTDMPHWRTIKAGDLARMRFHTSTRCSSRRDFARGAAYFNSLKLEMDEFDPIVRTGFSVRDDFDFMRSFDKVLFQTGTLSWWAAALSGASQVGVFGPWRGDSADGVNLSNTDFPGWFQWGYSG